MELLLNLSEEEMKRLILTLSVELSVMRDLYINSHVVDDDDEEDYFRDEDINDIINITNIINKIKGCYDTSITAEDAIKQMKEYNKCLNEQNAYNGSPLKIVKCWIGGEEKRVNLNFWTFKNLFSEAEKSEDMWAFVNRPREAWMGEAHPEKIKELLQNIYRLANGGIKEICDISRKTMKDLSEDLSIPYITLQRWKAGGIPKNNKVLISYAVLQF